MCPQKHLLHPQAQLAGLANLKQVTERLCAPQTPGKHTSCFRPCWRCAFSLWMIISVAPSLLQELSQKAQPKQVFFFARIRAEDSFWCLSPLLSRKCLRLHFAQLFLSWLPTWLNSWWIRLTAARCLLGANNPNALRGSHAVLQVSLLAALQ